MGRAELGLLDIGLGGVGSRNLDPCTSLHAASDIRVHGFRRKFCQIPQSGSRLSAASEYLPLVLKVNCLLFSS